MGNLLKEASLLIPAHQLAPNALSLHDQKLYLVLPLLAAQSDQQTLSPRSL